MAWCYAWRFHHKRSYTVNVGGSAQRCRVSRNGACVQAVRSAGFGSRGCQSPGMVDTCVRSRRECDVRRSTARAAAKRRFVIVVNKTRMIWVVYPHSFRHRFAKNFLEKYNDISLLADLMGHESIETTRIYLRMTAGEQRKIVNDVVT